MASERGDAPEGVRARPVPGDGLVFALLGHPSVQAIRFLSKACLVWFLTREEFGGAALAGLVVFAAQHAALLGTDDAVIQAAHLDRPLWRRLCRFHHATGLGLALIVALLGLVLGEVTADPELAALVAVLAPAVWLANLSVLPSALLLRARAFRRVLMVDLASVSGFAVTAVGLAVLGAGAWSLVGAWYANALVALVAAGRLARPELDRLGEEERADPGAVLRYGVQVSGASLLSLASERLDGLGVGVLIGRAALGLYEWALGLSQLALSYATSMAERCLFPILSEERRAGSLRAAHGKAFRIAAFGLLPLHVLLAFLARPLVTGLFPEEWHGAVPLLVLFALAAGLRCLEIVELTALKALGLGATLLRLAGLRLALLLVALALTLPEGDVTAVAAGVLVARAVALVSVLLRARAALSRAG
jgi:PST family polysaccharide transporter